MKLGRTIFKKGRDILKKRKKRQTKAHLQRKIKTSGKQKKNKQNGKKCPSYSKKIDGLKKKIKNGHVHSQTTSLLRSNYLKTGLNAVGR